MDTVRVTELFEAKEEGNVALLLEALRDPKHRFLAAGHLGELGAEEAAQPLIVLLRAGDVGSRSAAAEALGKLGASDAVPALIDLARDDEHIIPRTYAITTLGILGNAGAVEPLCALLDDESILIRQSAAQALGVLGHPDALKPLEAAKQRERWYSRRIHKKAIGRITRGTERGKPEGLRDGGGGEREWGRADSRTSGR